MVSVAEFISNTILN